MFAPTNNPYRFRYLVTGISGPGIEQVYLPERPPEEEILFKEEQKFTRPQMPEQLRKWAKEYHVKRISDPEYVHPHIDEISAWEDREEQRYRDGIFFWNNGNVEYITGFYYWFLTVWHPYFGAPIFRATDMEITYWIKFWEEDPNSYGGALNTIRRYGKSSLMGAWIVFRATRNFNHMAGMQGESDPKITKFYNKFILKPFYKLPPSVQPTYNLDTKQAKKIEFDIPAQRSKKRTIFESDEIETLESMIEYRASGAGEYDGEILDSYLMEEPGKTLKVSLYDVEGEGRWDVVKPCFLQGGEDITGKALLGTTVENMKVEDKGGKAYMRLFYDSDYNVRGEDGRTTSGLYAAFLPGRYAMKKYLDEFGYPLADQAWASISKTRRSYARRPTALANWIRKFPDTISEIFFVNPERCEFNSINIQEQREVIRASRTPLTERIELYWENGKRDTKVKWRHSPTGWVQVARGVGWNELPNNQVRQQGFHPDTQVPLFFPVNDNIYIGCDPIEHGVVSQMGKSSKPVVYARTKYNVDIDGELTQELLEKRAAEKYPYKTNRPLLLYDFRPTDPNKFFEYVIMICVYLGCPVHIENQKYALINYMHNRGYGGFILHKYKPEHHKPEKTPLDGTPSSVPIIQNYTSLVAFQKEYFCHLMPFDEILEDNLSFDPNNTKEHDYTVAEGFCEMVGSMPSQTAVQPVADIRDYLTVFGKRGEVLN